MKRFALFAAYYTIVGVGWFFFCTRVLKASSTVALMSCGVLFVAAAMRAVMDASNKS